MPKSKFVPYMLLVTMNVDLTSWEYERCCTALRLVDASQFQTQRLRLVLSDRSRPNSNDRWHGRHQLQRHECGEIWYDERLGGQSDSRTR